jgi:putative transcriptional regulator
MSMFEELMQGFNEMEAHIRGKETGACVHTPASIDVRGIRERLKLSQGKFAEAFGLSVVAVRNWESGKRSPEPSARALLAVIAYSPQVVIEALAQPLPEMPAVKGRGTVGKSGRPRKVAAA